MMVESINVKVWWEAQNTGWSGDECPSWFNSASNGGRFETAEEAFTFNRKRKESTLCADEIQWRIVKVIHSEEYIPHY